MAREVIDVDGHDRTVAVGDRRPVAAYVWGIVRTRLVDEITQEPPAAPVRLTTEEPTLATRVGSTGLVGPTGVPTTAFSMLGTVPYPVRFTVAADGYVPHEVESTVPIPGPPPFPRSFDPQPPLTVALHRAPMSIRGRVLLAPAMSPVGGASVSITGLWRTSALANAHPAVPPDPPHLVSLRPPLYARRDVGPGTLWRRDLVAIGGADKRLLAPAPARSRVVRISNAQSTFVGSILAIDAADPERTEHLVVAAVSLDGAINDPATVTLSHALAWSHRQSAVVTPVVPQVPAPPNAFIATGIRDETCVLLDHTTALAAGDLVEVSGGATSEYHRLQLFATTTDADGFYTLAPLSRVAKVLLRADDGVHLPVTVEHVPSYGREGDRADVMLH